MSDPPYTNSIVLVLFFFAILLLSTFFSPDGAIGSFLFSAMNVAPFVLLALFFMAGRTFSLFRRAGYIWAVLFILILTIFIWGMSLIALVPAEISETQDFAALEGDMHLFASIIIITFGSLLSAIFSCLCLLRPVAKYIAEYIPIDPESDLHRGGLAIIVSLILLPIISLAGTGVPIFLSDAHLGTMIMGNSHSSSDMDLSSLLWILIASFLIAGLFSERTLQQTLERLGLVKPAGQDLGVAILSGFGLVFVFLLLDHVISMVLSALGIPITAPYEQQLVLLFAGTMTIPGIIIASISAGFGEEISIRGLIQPRYGIILASLCFSALHAFQYQWDGLISVFLVGLIFGWMRTRWNTTTTVISHTVYDLVYFSLIMVGLVGFV